MPHESSDEDGAEGSELKGILDALAEGRVPPEDDEVWGREVLPRLRLKALGTIVPGISNPRRTRRFVAPVGFHAERHYNSYLDVGEKVWYTCKTIEAGGELVFVVTGPDMVEHKGANPNVPWNTVRNKVQLLRGKRTNKAILHGRNLFGMSHRSIKKMIQLLPGYDSVARDIKVLKDPAKKPPRVLKPTSPWGPPRVGGQKRPRVLHTTESSFTPVTASSPSSREILRWYSQAFTSLMPGD